MKNKHYFLKTLLLLIFNINMISGNLFRSFSNLFEKVNRYGSSIENKFDSFSLRALIEIGGTISIIILGGDTFKNYISSYKENIKFNFDFASKEKDLDIKNIYKNIQENNFEEIAKSFKYSIEIFLKYFNSPVEDIENDIDFKLFKEVSKNINLKDIKERHAKILKNLIEKENEYFKLTDNYFLILNSEIEDFIDLLNKEVESLKNNKIKIDFDKTIEQFKSLIKKILKTNNELKIESKKKEFLEIIKFNKGLINKLINKTKESKINKLVGSDFNKNQIINYSLIITGLFSGYKFYNDYKKEKIKNNKISLFKFSKKHFNFKNLNLKLFGLK